MVFLGRFDGKQRFATRTFHGTRVEAEEALEKLRVQVRAASEPHPVPSGSAGRRDTVATKVTILQAARRCFGRKGVSRTTMEDIAREAGLTRQQLYGFVSGRGELLDAVVTARLTEIIDGLRPVIQKADSFLDTIVEVSIAAIEGVRNDVELRRLLETSSTIRMHEMLAGPNPALQQLALRLFKKPFDAARRNGELRDDLSYEQILEWLRGVFLMLILLRDLSPDRARQLIIDFVVPSLRRH